MTGVAAIAIKAEAANMTGLMGVLALLSGIDHCPVSDGWKGLFDDRAHRHAGVGRERLAAGCGTVGLEDKGDDRRVRTVSQRASRAIRHRIANLFIEVMGCTAAPFAHKCFAGKCRKM